MLGTGLNAPDRTGLLLCVRSCVQSALVVLLLLAAPVSVAGAEPGARDARADPCPGPDPGCGEFTLPPWSDGAGWTDPSRYKTILTADLDGDGVVELLGRSSAGLEIWQMKQADASCAGPGTGCGRWELVTTNEDFSDANGFSDPLQASTIHAARLYGLPAEQVFAWTPDGVKVWQYDATLKTLFLRETVSSLRAEGDAHKPQYLETLQAAAWLPYAGDVQKGSLNLVMRFPDASGNLKVVGYCGPQFGWCFTGEIFGFDDSTRFGNSPYAWRTIHFGDIDNDGLTDVWGSDGIEIVWVKNDGLFGIPQPDFLLPSGTDWGQPAHYLTMIQGNFYNGRGAGGIQILLRASDTLHLIFWEADDKVFHEAYKTLENDKGTLLTDSSLDPTEYSGTWQSLDVDGDGATELIVRTPGGVRVYTLTFGFPNAFSEITQPGFTNSDRWAGDSRARTIRIVKSGKAFLVIGRSAIGIQTGRLVPGMPEELGRFDKVSATFPQMTGTDLIAYDSISAQLGIAANGVRSVYSNSQADIGTYLTLMISVKNPDMDPVVWQRVFDQVQRELTWASFSAALFSANEKVINESFLGTSLTATAVVQRLNIDDARAKAEETREEKFVLSLAGDMSQFLSLFPSKGINFIFNVFSTMIGQIKTSPDNLPSSIAQFDQRLAAMFQDSLTHNSLSHTDVASDYGLLAEVGSLVQSGTWPVSEDTRLRMLAASQHSLELQLWKAVTPSAWKIFACGANSDNSWPNFSCDGTHAGAFTFDNQVRSWPVVDLSVTFEITEPNATVVQKMFNAAPQSCLTNWDLVNCGFGLDPAAVYRGQTDFHFPCVSIVGNDISGFSREEYNAPCDQIGPSLDRVAPFPRQPRPVKPRRATGQTSSAAILLPDTR